MVRMSERYFNGMYFAAGYMAAQGIEATARAVTHLERAWPKPIRTEQDQQDRDDYLGGITDAALLAATDVQS